jgi:hypothetical protein
MTTVRITGLVIGVLAIGWGIVRRRRGGTRGEALTWSFVGLGIVFLSVVPDIAGPLRDSFEVASTLTAVLMLAVIALVFVAIAERARRHALEAKFGELVRALALADFQERAHEAAVPTIAVVMPAYNEAPGISAVLDELPETLAGYVLEPIVVVDGADDGTAAAARRAGRLVVSLAVNRGQGDALRTGFQLALHRGAEIVMTMDADGQHSPDDMISLVKPIVAGEADYVQGSRFTGTYDDIGGLRDGGIRMFTWLLNRLSGTNITDCTNGFRAIRAEKLAGLRLEEGRFSAPELVMESAARGLRIVEVPVHIRSRTFGESKKPRRLAYPLGFLRVIARVWLR